MWILALYFLYLIKTGFITLQANLFINSVFNILFCNSGVYVGQVFGIGYGCAIISDVAQCNPACNLLGHFGLVVFISRSWQSGHVVVIVTCSY